jgi:hypothetical protein
MLSISFISGVLLSDLYSSLEARPSILKMGRKKPAKGMPFQGPVPEFSYWIIASIEYSFEI